MTCRRCSREFLHGDTPEVLRTVFGDLPVHAYDCSDPQATQDYVEAFLEARGIAMTAKG